MGGYTQKITVSDQWLWEHRAVTVAEMARELGVSDNGLRNAIRRQKPPRWRTRTGALAIPADWLEKQAETRSLYSVATELMVGSRQLATYAREHGIKFTIMARTQYKSSCPCEHELQCLARALLGYGCLCEVEEDAA